MTKKLLFITDPLNGLKPKKDTSIFMMEEAISLGYKVYQSEMNDLFIQNGIVFADSRNIIAAGSNKIEGISKRLKLIQNFGKFWPVSS